MALRPCARSLHFSLHFRGAEADSQDKLSTGASPEGSPPVDDSPADTTVLHLGLVVPKRHARRSVTRNLVKRQLREQVRLGLPQMPAGDWVLRLRSPFDRQQFPSAASDALRAAVRAELVGLLADARRRVVRALATGHAAASSARAAPVR